ncbi:hypothetical protein EW145_g4397 [Phellinidium pouzarii]|uniref:VPS9 domain-containing protein n=1 Tax=Phellinidium pouzarii TaxID=167371 RepID=A0A4S4L3U0_9AGAM|nr:hypothetical protein EW145_g4397 [Phellinidium pouzarii]
MKTTDDLSTNLHHLSIAPTPAAHNDVDGDIQEVLAVNPWEEQADAAHNLGIAHALKTPDPSALDAELDAHKVVSESYNERKGVLNQRVSKEVLNEFDPLVDEKEAEAKPARENAEGYPMSPEDTKVSAYAESAVTPAIPVNNASSSTSAHGIGLPSLASFARSFSIPKVRTRSVDIAPPVNVFAPNTITTFAATQQRPSTPVSSASSKRPEGSADGSSRQGSGTMSLRPGKERGRRKDEPPPFDFQLFLDQMKVKSAEPVAKYLRSYATPYRSPPMKHTINKLAKTRFLSNFAKKSFPVNEQIRVINEFLNFIAVRMHEAEVWRNATDAEFDNAIEAMEKLVMNRLYEFTFTPQVAEADPPRPITTDDLERDRILAQRIALFGWVEEKHLEVPEGTDSRGFLMFAQQELLKINHYKAPRDKLICVLNCCKSDGRNSTHAFSSPRQRLTSCTLIVAGLIRHLHKEESADAFIPILIFVVLKANPPNLISSIDLVSLPFFAIAMILTKEKMGAVQFIETMDHTGLSNITAEEFERNVEDAIHGLPASPNPSEKPSVPTSPSSSRPSTPFPLSDPSTPAKAVFSPRLSAPSPHAGEESAQPLALTLGGIGGGFADDTRRFLQRTGDALGKPLNVLGRILGEALDGLDGAAGSPPGASASINSGHERADSANAGTYVPGPFAPYEMAREGDAAAYTPAPRFRAGTETPPIATPYKPRVRQLPLGGYLSPGTPPSTVSGTPSGLSGRSTPESAQGWGTPSRSAPGTYPVRGGELGFGPGASLPAHLGSGVSRTPTPALDIVGLQEEIDVAHERAASAALGTLTQIFPGVDQEVIEWVLEAEDGDLGRSIEKLLEVGGGLDNLLPSPSPLCSASSSLPFNLVVGKDDDVPSSGSCHGVPTNILSPAASTSVSFASSVTVDSQRLCVISVFFSRKQPYLRIIIIIIIAGPRPARSKQNNTSISIYSCTPNSYIDSRAMANYLPVLLVSVTAGMPDDAAVQPLPRGQVDYLSHDWAEEDVWRSWRNMTKQKNEIANGTRLENASWRTWWKQRNNLKTVSPETLNWLKDSDVTWLYGPLHTAVDWLPPQKVPTTPPSDLVPSELQQHRTQKSSKAIRRGTMGKSCLSSPSSSIALDQYHLPESRYSSHERQSQGTMKPILKHRSIAEMLSSALPAAPAWSEDGATGFAMEEDCEDDEDDGTSSKVPSECRAAFSGRSGRPPMFHTKSDTHLLPRFDRGKNVKVSPPRVAPAAADREPVGLLSANQRTGASNNLVDLALSIGAPGIAGQGQGIMGSYWGAAPAAPAMDSADSSASEAASSGWSEAETGSVSPNMTQPPQKKHISFNAIVEQYIAIDGGSAPLSPSTRQGPWTEYDDGYAEDNEDGLYEDVSIHEDSDSDDQHNDDGILEIKPPSRRVSTSSLQDVRSTMEGADVRQLPPHLQPSTYSSCPPFRHSSASKSSRLSRSRASGSGSRSGSGSNSTNTSQASRSRLNVGSLNDREHVSIAPIAPTILKAGGAEENEDGVLYMGGSYSQFGHSGSNHLYGGAYGGSSYANNYNGNGNYSGGGVYGSSYGYGYGGYGYGEDVSAGRSDAFEHFERGTEGGELVYQSPNGNVYPWGERDAVRFRMLAEYGMPSPAGSPPRSGKSMAPQQRTGSTSSMSSNDPAHFVPGPVVDSPSPNMDAEEAEFEYFDRAEPEPDLDQEQETEHMNASEEQAQFRPHRRADDMGRDRHGEDTSVRIVVPYSNGGAVSVDQRNLSGVTHERTPSPEFPPKVNPRIASLKSETSYRSPQSLADGTMSAGVPSIPSGAMLTPGISTALEEPAQVRSQPDSPLMQSGLLSPPEMSPGRGRSTCTSPVSGYMTSGSATSSSGLTSTDSRSVSESRSDSRGRSRTRNSSASTFDQEQDRGRSRSRSTASGANSPLSDSASPHVRCPPMVIGITGGVSGQHSGREVRDGRGMRIYRKTSEDLIDVGRQGSVGSSLSSGSTRGRNRDGRRISESLSPPTLGSAPVDIVSRGSVASPPNSGLVYRPIPASGLNCQSYSVNTFGQGVSPTSSSNPSLNLNKSEKPFSQNGTPIVKLPTSPGLALMGSQDSSDSMSSAGSSTASAGGRTLPSCIPEEDEQRFRDVTLVATSHSSSVPLWTQPSAQTKSVPSSPSPDARAPRVKTGSANSSKPTTPTPEVNANKVLRSGSVSPPPLAVRSKANGASAFENSGAMTRATFADRAAELVSSARTLLGTIWNGTTM